MNIVNNLRFLKTGTIFAIAMLLVSNNAAAFTVDKFFYLPVGWFYDPIHEDITRDALSGLPPARLSNGQSIAFSGQAITEIADSNINADTVYFSAPERHFDMEMFASGRSALHGMRMAIVADLKGPTGSGQNARDLLGGALHTVQDFYAHSTWVENGFGGTAPSLGKPDPIPNFDPTNSADLCGDQDILPVVPIAQLTSGFYDVLNLQLGSNYYSWLVSVGTNLPIKKCSHGKGTHCNDTAICPSEDVNFNYSAGINKDTPVRRHHSAARIAATASTRDYVQLILGDLGNDVSADVAKCKLMGQDCYMLFLQKDGTGTGTIIVSDPPANEVMQNCGVDCTQVLRSGTLITLEARPDTGFEFLGWGEDCSAHGTTNPIQVTLSSTLICKATFGVLPALTVTLQGNGSGSISSVPAGIQCNPTCQAEFDASTSVTLTATADKGSVFKEWSGDCSGTQLQTTVVMDQDKHCIAQFDLLPKLTVSLTGQGTGGVGSVPAGIQCPPDCDEQYAVNTSVDLTANAGQGSVFKGWSGDCSGTVSPYTLNMTSNKSCTAKFELDLQPAVRLNPFGNVSSGPFYVEVVDKTLSLIPAPQDITVTLLRQVFSQCRGLLFSSNRTVIISQSQTSAAFNFTAGHDPFCNTLPITTELTITAATMGGNALDLSFIPAPQRKVTITQ